jgi:hypothetical protein
MNKELSPSLRGFALQIALQLPDDQRQAISVLRYAREIVERGPEKLGHAVRTSDIGVAGTKSPEHKRRGSDILFK